MILVNAIPMLSSSIKTSFNYLKSIGITSDIIQIDQDCSNKYAKNIVGYGHDMN